MNKEIEPNTRCESYSICCSCGKKIFNKDFYSVINGVGLYCRNCYFRLFQNESDYYQLQIAKKDQRIAELEEQLKNARKETAKKVIDRVEELGVFDFEAYEEMDFRRYIIAEMALDNILREYGE